jgi:hypothetical protein
MYIYIYTHIYIYIYMAESASYPAGNIRGEYFGSGPGRNLRKPDKRHPKLQHSLVNKATYKYRVPANAHPKGYLNMSFQNPGVLHKGSDGNRNYQKAGCGLWKLTRADPRSLMEPRNECQIPALCLPTGVGHIYSPSDVALHCGCLWSWMGWVALVEERIPIQIPEEEHPGETTLRENTLKENTLGRTP